MTDILIRGVTAEALAAIDAKAKRLGLSRVEYLRRTLERERSSGTGTVEVADLARVTALAADLDDPGLMTTAWL